MCHWGCLKAFIILASQKKPSCSTWYSISLKEITSKKWRRKLPPTTILGKKTTSPNLFFNFYKRRGKGKANEVKSISKQTQKTLKTQWKSICINCWNISIIITNWHAMKLPIFPGCSTGCFLRREKVFLFICEGIWWLCF